MKKGKYQTGVSKRLVVLPLALVLLLGCGIGGTIAYLMDTTETVTNTFAVGDVNIELKEHKLNADGTLDQNTEVTEEKTYKIVPGTSQPKDPFVRVQANSEDSWIFVQVKEVRKKADTGRNDRKCVDWNIDSSVWSVLESNDTDGVHTFYTSYTTSTEDTLLNVLMGKTVTYSSDLTKKMIEALDTDKSGKVEEDEMPQLIFKAFAVQAEATTLTGEEGAADAWSQIASGAKLTATSNP